MRELHLRDAKATFSAVVEAAEKGEATTVTKHGRPVAMVVPVEEGRRIHASTRPSFASLLMAIPHELETGRDETPVREADL
jgi:antitoxin Phd